MRTIKRFSDDILTILQESKGLRLRAGSRAWREFQTFLKGGSRIREPALLLSRKAAKPVRKRRPGRREVFRRGWLNRRFAATVSWVSCVSLLIVKRRTMLGLEQSRPEIGTAPAQLCLQHSIISREFVDRAREIRLQPLPP